MKKRRNAGSRPPPCGLGAIDPVSRRRWSRLRIHVILTLSRAAISARAPSQAAATRSRGALE